MNDAPNRTQQIEGRIDREVAGAMVPVPAGGAFNLVPKDMGQALEFAKLVAVSGDCIRPAFRNNPGACLALCLQAWRWGADPFAVANKAYITTGKAGTQIAYEAQLVHGIINSSAVLAKRLRHSYDGQGAQRRCRIVGWVHGEDEPLEYISPTIAQIAVKNSPLWQGDPDQQLAYYSTRAWARRHVPEILLGIYTPEEVGETIDVTPVHVQEATTAATAAAEPEPEPEPWRVFDHTGTYYEFQKASLAVEACRKVLIGAAADPQTLATAWENNHDFLIVLGEEGLTLEVEALERLHGELAPRIERESDIPFVPPATAPASGAGSNGTTGAAPASSPAGRGPTATTAASPSETVAPPRQEAAQTRSEPEPPVTTPAPEQPSAAPQSAEQHDPFWDQASLTIEPPQRRGASMLSREWKVWPLMILPRVRQAWTLGGVNQLYEDNEAQLERFGVDQGQAERDRIVMAFEDARTRLAG